MTQGGYGGYGGHGGYGGYGGYGVYGGYGGYGGLTVGLDAGIVATGAPAPYSPLLSASLAAAADGIAVPWKGALQKNHLPGDDPELMRLWAPWVRGFILSTEILPGLHFRTATGDRIEIAALAPGEDDTLRTVPLFSAIRPPMEVFRQQLELVRAYADLRPDRQGEIITQLGFPSPYFGSIVSLHPSRDAHVIELIAIVQGLGATLAMRVKHALACRRPDELSEQIMPMIPTPGHGAFPAAHAVEAFAVADLLKMLFFADPRDRRDQDGREALDRQAARISANRVVAGVHYPIDSYLGAVLGRVLVAYLAERAGVTVTLQSAAFDGTRIPTGPAGGAQSHPLGTAADFDFEHALITPDFALPGLCPHLDILSIGAAQARLGVSEPLRWLWAEAVKEIAARNTETAL